MSKELIEQGIEVLFRGGRKSFGPAGDQFLKTLSKKDKFNLKNLHKVNPEGFEGFGESVRRTYDGPQDQGAVDAGWNIIGTLDDLELKGKDAWEQQLNLDAKNIPDNIEPEVKPKAYNLSEDVEDFMGDTDLETARAWENPDGGLDQEIKKMLTVGRKTTITTPKGEKVTLNKGDMMTPDMLTGTKLDYYNSLIATGHQTSPDDILTYGPWDVKQQSKMASLEGVDPEFSPQLHKGKTFHHKAMKEIQSTIHKRARALRESGEATTDDLINLHALSNAKGAPSGSRAKAGLWMEEFGHSFGHKKISQPKGIEPTTTKWTNEPLKKGKSGKPTRPPETTPEVFKAALEAADELGVPITRYDLNYIQSWSTAKAGLSNAIAKWKVLRKNKTLYELLGPDGESEMSRLLKSTENMNIAELTQFQKEVLDDITLPMTEEMVLMEEVMDLLNPRELIELMKNKKWDTLENLRRTVKDKKAAMKEAKSAKAERKLESAIEHLN